MDFIESCRKLISLDTSPSHGTREAIRFLAELCRAKGLEVEIQEEIWADLEQANLIARPKGLGSARPAAEIMFQTHIDTADPGPFGFWSETGHNPYDAHIVDGNIYGLGTADVKLDFLCKLEAISQFSDRSEWRLPPVLVATFGEETGMMGSLKLIRKNKVTPKMALIGEPSDLRILASGKGIAAVEIVIPFSDEEKRYKEEHNLRESTSTQSKLFHGKSAHSSTPHLGESAIKKMLDFLLNLPTGVVVMEIDGGVNFNTVPSNAFLELDLTSGNHEAMASKISTIYRQICGLETEFLRFEDRDFNPSHPTLNIGIIRTSSDSVSIGGSCRIPPMISNEVYESWMRRLELACKSVGAQFRVTDYKRPFSTDPNSILVRGCCDELKQLGLDDRLSTQSSTSEASLFSRIGVECVAFGPGRREGNIHTPKEHVSVEDLNRAIEFYKKIIERFSI